MFTILSLVIIPLLLVLFMGEDGINIITVCVFMYIMWELSNKVFIIKEVL